MKNYPSELNLDEGDLPEVKKWKVGGVYNVTLKIKEVHSGYGPYPDDSDKDKIHARFQVLSAQVKEDEKYDQDSVKEAMNEKSKKN